MGDCLAHIVHKHTIIIVLLKCWKKDNSTSYLVSDTSIGFFMCQQFSAEFSHIHIKNIYGGVYV